MVLTLLISFLIYIILTGIVDIIAVKVKQKIINNIHNLISY